MANVDNNNRNNRSNASGGTRQSHGKNTPVRDRRRDQVLNTVKERPYTAAALATVAAGAAAFFLTRGKSDKPLMNWGQQSEGDRLKGAGAYKQQGSTTSDRSLETTSASPSSSAGASAGTGGTSPSAVQAATLAGSGTSTNAAAGGSSGGSTSKIGSINNDSKGAGSGNSGTATTGARKTAGSGIDATSQTETKAGAISYGA